MKPQYYQEKITLMGFLTLLLLMIGLITEVLLQFQEMNQSVKELVKKNHNKLSYAYEMRDAIQSRANSLKNMLVEPDPFLLDEEYLKFQIYAGQYRTARVGILSISLTPAESLLHAKLRDHTRIAMPLNQYASELLLNKATNNKTEILKALHIAINAQNILLKILEEFIVIEKQDVIDAVKKSEQTYQANFRYIVIFSGLILILGASVATWVVHQSSRQHQKLSYQANHDVLTGLLNRAAFEKQLEAALNHFKIKQVRCGLLYMDLDFFKQVNDTCGHPAGDQLLQELSQHINQCLDVKYYFGRIGGDEFTVLLPDCKHKEVTRVANNILQVVSEFKFRWKEHSFKVGISIGVACIEKPASSISDLLNLADKACYQAKNKGRNRIEFANSTLLS